MSFYSEYGQDSWLEANIFKGKRLGMFVDIGALDGVFHSNTYFFEQERNWTGICVEPNPIMFKQLVNSRTSMNLNCAVSSTNDIVEFLQIEGNLRGWSGIIQLMEPEHLQRINERDLKKNIIKIPSISLDKIVPTYRRIDYLSIDVEGAECDIVSSFPFENYDIDIMEVEVNFDYNLDTLIKSKGFKLLERLGVSNIYRRVNNG
jgi:FkbM family methyltransferase